MFRKADLSRFDLWLPVFVVLLVLIGIINIYSAGFDPMTKVNNGMFQKQIIWAVIGIAFMTALSLMSFRIIEANSLYIYAGVLVVVVLTTFLAPPVRNTRAWITLGFFSIQPSEFMKLAAIVVLAKYIELRERDLQNFRELFIPALLVFVPMLFIMLQPDFGTALIFIPVLFTMLFVGGADVTHLISITAIAIIGLFVPIYITFRDFTRTEGSNLLIDFFKTGSTAYIVCISLLLIGAVFFALRFVAAKKFYRRIYIPAFVFSLGLFIAVLFQRSLRDYQKSRILVFLNPDLDPRGAGYNVIQSKIAIGSGGFFGKGFLKGTQTQLGFLPEKTSDFIFPVIAEEWGFLGALLTLGLILGIVYQGFRISLEANDKFSSLLAAGISAVFFFHALINIGMVIGLTPVTGIPLPFVSYGGTNLMMSMMAIGILISIKMRKN
jgi:rod shape determining protein RodA